MNPTTLAKDANPACICLAAFTSDFNTALKMSESIARQSAAAAFITYWKNRDDHSELKVAAACDGISTFATVGRLTDRRFTPGEPLNHLPGRLGDAVKEVLDSAAANMPGLPNMPEYESMSDESLKHSLAGYFETIAHNTLDDLSEA